MFQFSCRFAFYELFVFQASTNVSEENMPQISN